MPSLFLGSNWQYMPVCAKTAWVRKVLSIPKVHMSLGTP